MDTTTGGGMKAVFLDAGTLPAALAPPAWLGAWRAYAHTPAHAVAERLADADIAITNKVPLGRADLARLPRLALVCVAATGYDCIDLQACRERGVAVCNVPGYSAQSVAEWVVGCLYALRRRLPHYMALARRDWPGAANFCVHGEPQADVAGSTLGIVGRGAIGRRVGELASAVGVRVLYAERRGRAPRDGYHDFDEVLARSDAVSLHCPLDADTHGLMGAAQFARMRPGALLINSARGALVDEAALCAALAGGRLGGAALDVLAAEPPGAGHPLWALGHPNLIVTPHVGWAAQDGVQGLARGILQNLEAFRRGQPANRVA